MERPRTVGELRESGYQVQVVKEEMRRNLIAKLRAGEAIFPGIIGYEQTVIPQIQNAILACHDILLLGLRGQAKTRMLRMMTGLLDEAIPIVAGSEVNDNPFAPISKNTRDRLQSEGDRCPIEWIGREQRYHEKLATPDVTIADLLGEIDMIKHAEGRYLSSELTMHFGLIPRTNRGIFCMNELPDLAPKIQVGLFNVLEERDVQIRGYPVQLNLDICMIFSANPEDYTNRGRIVTPLKDRIGSVVRTHYPLTREIGIQITDQNVWVARDSGVQVHVPCFMKEIIEETARLVRRNAHVNQASGVSVRMSIANYESMVSNSERRAIRTGEAHVVPRISDLAYITASSRGKIELTMSEEDGQEDKLISRVLSEAVKKIFDQHLDVGQFRSALSYFEEGKAIDVGDLMPSANYVGRLAKVPALKKPLLQAAQQLASDLIDSPARDALVASVAEFVLEGLHVHNKLNKNDKTETITYRR